MFAPCDYLHAGITIWPAIDDYLNLIDTIIVLWKLRSLFLGVPFNSLCYLDMFAANSKKQS
jgi:hypothetical protein